jgi:hypothetical protein
MGEEKNGSSQKVVGALNRIGAMISFKIRQLKEKRCID